MIRNLLTIILLTINSLAFGQKNFIDQAFVETTATADTLVVPDLIYISININEADSKNKKSVEDQEKLLETSLKRLGIDTEKDLSLHDFSSNYKNYFLKGQNVVKAKAYTLLVTNAITAGKVFAELESVGISNVSIERTEYSKAEELLLELKSKAVEKSKLTAEKLAKPLNQKIGKALYIADYAISNAMQGQGQGHDIRIRGMSISNESRVADPINIEFKKVKFEVRVNIKYVLE